MKKDRLEEAQNKLKTSSFEFEDESGIKHCPTITLEDALEIVERLYLDMGWDHLEELEKIDPLSKPIPPKGIEL